MADRPPLSDCGACRGTGEKVVQKLETYRDSKGRQMGRTVTMTVECNECGGSGQQIGAPA